METPRGWRPLSAPRPAGPEALLPSPFARLARTHALTIMGDTLIALALADSLFFSIDPNDARWRVALYLLLTMAPFALVAPLIGPAIDRAEGGRRLMVLLSAAARAVVCIFMIDDIDGVLLYPEAFAVLVLGKGYTVARSALVPAVVRSTDELVEANSKLSLISGLAGFVIAVPGVLLLYFGGAEWVLALAVVSFAGATLMARRIPKIRIAVEAPGDLERRELRSAGILMAASAMALLRGIVGFLTFLLAFSLRNGDAPAWWFGVIIAAAAVGGVAGAAVAPPLRRSMQEERILAGSLGGLVVFGLVCAQVGGRPAWAIMAMVVGLAASAGKLAFDAIVQRDAPDANQGRSFARFETRFQLVWVAGGFLPVVIPLPAGMGLVLIAGVAGFAAFSYGAGLRTAQRGQARGS